MTPPDDGTTPVRPTPTGNPAQWTLREVCANLRPRDLWGIIGVVTGLVFGAFSFGVWLSPYAGNPFLTVPMKTPRPLALEPPSDTGSATGPYLHESNGNPISGDQLVQAGIEVPLSELRIALKLEPLEEVFAQRLGLAFDSRECAKDECAVLKLAFYNPGTESINDVMMLCTFSGAIIALNPQPGVDFCRRDGTPISNPREQVLYRNNASLRIAAVAPGSFVIPVLLFKRGANPTAEANCVGLKANFVYTKVDWGDLPEWVTKDIDSVH